MAADLHERGGLDLSECYIDDSTFIVAKKGGTKLERPSGAKKVRSSWQYQTMLVFLSPYTLRLLLRHMKSPLLKQLSVSKCFVSDEKPEHLVGDKAYDSSDPLDEKLAIEYDVEMISPHRGWRKRPKKTQDGRPLRRYKHRWKIERLFFAWLQNFHRILVRHDYYSENFLGFVLLGCIMILFRRCL